MVIHLPPYALHLMQWNTKRVTNLKTVEFNVQLVFIEFSSLQFKLLQRECLLGSAMVARL